MSRFTTARKALATVLVAAPLSLSLVACGSDESDPESADSTAAQSTAANGDNANAEGDEGEDTTTEGEEGDTPEDGDNPENTADGEPGEPGEQGSGNRAGGSGNNAGGAAAGGAAAGGGGAAAGGSAPDIAAAGEPLPPPNGGDVHVQDTSGVESAIHALYDPRNHDSMGAQWRGMQHNVCRRALEQGWSEAGQHNEVVTQIDPAILNNQDVLALLDQQPAQGEPQHVESISNVVINGDTATADVVVSGQQANMSLVHEDGRWKVC